MIDNKKITIGENLKRIRKELGLKQYEITGGKITRNLISLIENNKAKLYENNAIIIAENINNILIEKNLDMYIESEDILNPKRYEAKKKSNIYIEKLEQNLVKKNYNIEEKLLVEMESFLNKWNLNYEKIKIYELLGDIYYYSNDFDKEFLYLTRALESSFLYPNRKDNYKIISKLVSNCINTDKYKEAIRLGNFGLKSKKNMPNEHKAIFHYNNALAYKKLDLINESIEELNSAKKHVKTTDYDTTIKILTLEGICYLKKGKYKSSLNTYNQALHILKSENNYEDICLIYVNIIEIFIKQKDTNNILKYLDIINNLIPHVNENSLLLAKIHLEISNAYFFLKDYDSTEKHLKKALIYAKNNNGKNLYVKMLLKLLEFYNKTNEFEKINNYIEDLKEETLNIPINDEINLCLSLILYYVEHDYNEKAQQLIKQILKERGQQNDSI